jgi:hypothetical protein
LLVRVVLLLLGVYEIRDDDLHLLFASKDARPMAFVKKEREGWGSVLEMAATMFSLLYRSWLGLPPILRRFGEASRRRVRVRVLIV